MAKRKSLKERIDALFNALGAAEKPTIEQIRNELSSWSSLAETLENGQALEEKEARITDLETELGRLQVELQTTNTALETFQVERKKQKEDEQDIPDIQYRILRELPSEHGGDGLTMNSIRSCIAIPLDETEIHVDRLQQAKLIVWEEDRYGQCVWRRTKAGNEFVVAKRLAGDEPQARKRHHDLSVSEALTLLSISKSQGVSAEELQKQLKGELPTITVMMVELLLIKLREKEMATDGDEPDYGAPRLWVILRAGAEYLAERGLL